MNNLQLINLFSLNVYTSYLENINNNILSKEIEEYSGSIPDVKDPYPAHTFYEDRNYPFEKSECKKLFFEIKKTVSLILNKEMKIDSIWTLSLNKGQSVTAHTHKINTHLYPEEYFSISYYINAPENSADLIFTTSHCNAIETSTSIAPRTGMLILFNSYINHMTNRHYNDEPRLVVSANLSPVNPNLSQNPDWSAYSIPNNYLNKEEI